MTRAAAVGVIDEAITLIHEHGWGKGDYRNPVTGCYCLSGAVLQQWEASWDATATAHETLNEVARERYEGAQNVVDANDNRIQTQEEAIALLEATKERLVSAG